MKLSEVPAIVRVLLCTDGTVTRSLQAYFDEPIDVQVLRQFTEELPAEDQWMQCRVGERVVRRQVRLQGRETGRVYAYADTVLQTGRLPDSVQKGLTEGAFGIGELMQLRGLETYREVLMSDYASELPRIFSEHPPTGVETDYLWRHYTIRHNQRVLMHIKEYFPLATYHHTHTLS